MLSKPTEKLWVRIPEEIRDALEVLRGEAGITIQQMTIDALALVTNQADESTRKRLKHVQEVLARVKRKKKKRD